MSSANCNLKVGEERAKELGLKHVHRFKYATLDGLEDVYLASDVHRVLGEGVEVSGFNEGSWWIGESKSKNDTHTALLIGIRPIKPKTVEFNAQVKEETLKQGLYSIVCASLWSEEMNPFIGKEVKVTVTEVVE